MALRLLVDRRDELGAARTDTVNRLHRLLVELIDGGAKKFLSATQARALLASVRPRDLVGRTRRQLAAELIVELAGIDKRIKAANKQLRELVEATGSTLLDLNGIGPSGAARLLGDIGDVSRFPTRGHFASWNGTAPIDAFLRGAGPASTVPGREPANQPGAAHHGHRAAAQRHRRPRLLPARARRRQDQHGSHPRTQAAAVRRRLPPTNS